LKENNRLKILFLIDTLQTGGAERSILEIASKFTKYQAVVCHLYHGEELKPEYLRAGIEVHSLNIAGRYNFSTAAREVSALISEIKPAIIHSSLFRADIVSRLVRHRNDILLINSLVNNSYHASRFSGAGFMMKLKLTVVKLIDRFSAGSVDVFVSNSETIKISSIKDLHIPAKKIKVIYRGRPLEKFANIDPGNVLALKKALGLPDQTKVFLNVSRLLGRKGHFDLIEAIAKVINDVRDVVFLVAGDGPIREELIARVRQLKLEPFVRILGNRSDIPQLLALADFFVFPSHYEGLPGALIEAMMAKVPIIASAIPENLECVGSESAFLHRAGNTDELAAAIVSAYRSPGKASSHTAVAYSDAVRKFDIKSVAGQYESLYDEILTRRPT